MTLKNTIPLLNLAIFAVICAVFGYGVFRGIEQYQKKQWSQAFTKETEKIITVLDGKFEINLHNLISIRSIFHASTEVTPSEFQIFTKPLLSKFKFIQALEWIPRVPDSDREMYENRMRNAGLPRFQFTELLHPGKMIRAGSRSEYFPVYYVEPMEGNESAFGFDLSSNPSRLKSIRKSRDSGGPIVTAKIKLVQEKSTQNGVLIFLPIFDGIAIPETITERRSKLKGFVLGVYRLDEMFKHMLSPYVDESVNVVAYDGDKISETNRLAGKLIPNSPLQDESKIHFVQANWLLVVQGSSDFLNGLPVFYSYMGGTSAFLILLFGWAFIHTQKSQALIQKITAIELAQLIDTANAPIFGVDNEGNVNEWNLKVQEITGFAKDEVMGQNLVNIHIKKEYRSSFKKVLDDALQGRETSNNEVPLFGKDGKRVMVLWNATTRRNFQGDITGVLGVGQDITELDEYRKDLQRKVEEQTNKVTKSLDIARETNIRLQEANRHKSQFLSSMSHELRTPLNSILGFSDLLMGQHFGKLNDKQSGYVNQIESSGKHLLDLISDLLDVAKIDAGKMELTIEECLPEACFSSRLSMVEPQLKKKKIKIESVIDPSIKRIFCDIRKVKQIMVNLLSNAIKYSPEGGVIKVNVLKETDFVKIEVTDSGLGISKEYQETIFSEFLQVDRARDEALGGTGIGLALTRRLVELHGGDIGVQSEEGKGSVFWFTLPDREPPASGKPIKADAAEKAISYPTGRRILVVEDNEVNLIMVLDMLRIHEHEVFVARNGREAIDKALSSQPELILMDIRMPVMDGMEATKKIKNMEETSHIPIIALTASVGAQSVEKCIEAGCQDHLPKPIQSKGLFDMLQRYLNAKV